LLKRGVEKGLFVVCHTSNDMASDFQTCRLTRLVMADICRCLFICPSGVTAALRRQRNDWLRDGRSISDAQYESEAARWRLVVAAIRDSLLVEYSSGQLEELVGRASFYPFLLSCSRGIIHTSEEADFAQAAANAAEGLRNRINMVLENKEGCRVG
jgi:hypothetical protein